MPSKYSNILMGGGGKDRERQKAAYSLEKTEENLRKREKQGHMGGTVG